MLIITYVIINYFYNITIVIIHRTKSDIFMQDLSFEFLVFLFKFRVGEGEEK